MRSRVFETWEGVTKDWGWCEPVPNLAYQRFVDGSVLNFRSSDLCSYSISLFEAGQAVSRWVESWYISEGL